MTKQLHSQPASGRGERLDPPKSSRIYWHLTKLRETYERLAGLAQLEEHTRLLDFGCGNMPYRPLFEQKGLQYLGCDLPGNELADILLQEGGSIPLESRSIDVVLSSQVLEHVLDPGLYLDEACRVLKAGGSLFLTTHGIWQYHPDPRDLWRWTCDGLKSTIEAHGFSVQEMQGIMGPEATALQLWQDAVLPRVHHRFRKVFTRYAQLRIQWADERCQASARDSDACVYSVVAVKI